MIRMRMKTAKNIASAFNGPRSLGAMTVPARIHRPSYCQLYDTCEISDCLVVTPLAHNSLHAAAMTVSSSSGGECLQ